MCALIQLHVHMTLKLYKCLNISDPFVATVSRPVYSRSDTEQARRSQVLQDGDKNV